jgi:uncharacterized protein (DUF302 family)
MPFRHRIPTPVRFWRTGAIAVVMAALGGPRLAAAQDRPMASQLSRYGVTQTAARLEATARRHGLAVFASVAQPAPAAGAPEVLVLVLESPQGGTPVLMQGDGDELRSEVPLRLELRQRGDGASEVRYPAGASGGLPEEVAADLAELESLVSDALGRG